MYRIPQMENRISLIEKKMNWLLVMSAISVAVAIFKAAQTASIPQAQPPTIPAQSVGSNNAVNIGATPKPESKRTFLTVKDVAERENVSERTIITAISQGRIEPQPERDGRAWVVSADYRFLPIIAADSGTNQ